MGNFTSSFVFQTKFDGDNVSATLRRLKTAQMAKLSKYMKPGQTLDFENQVEMLSVAGEIIPDCMVSFSGITAADGSAVELKTILDDFYFSSLVDQWLGALINASILKANEVKKSDAPSLGSVSAEPSVTQTLKSEESASNGGQQLSEPAQG